MTDPTAALIARLEVMAAQLEYDVADLARLIIDGISRGWKEHIIKDWVSNAAHLAGRALTLREAAQTLQTQAATIDELRAEIQAMKETA